uniref:LEA type 2 family protein n=1 Tax=Cupriavidus yeoncheonensis TaxID=1462994 RepID=UPI003F49AA15
MLATDTRRSIRLYFICLCILAWLGGCAALTGQEPLRVTVAGIDPMEGEGWEMRFNVKLRIQNPNDSPIEFSGLSLQLDLNGQSFASGVSDQSGVVPRFGETVIDVPLTVPAFAAVRQAFAFVGGARAGNIPYEVHGRLAGGMGGGTRFTDHGKLSLPEGMMSP